VWTQLESGRVVHRFEPIVLVATLAVIPVIIIESEAKSSVWKDFAIAANWLIWAVFAAELAFILIVAPRKGAALSAHWLDAVIVVVTAPLFGKFLASLRLLRLARLLRASFGLPQSSPDLCSGSERSAGRPSSGSPRLSPCSSS
jgi:hypothetical protein